MKNLIEGLAIFQTCASRCYVSCEHDILYISDYRPEDISTKDTEKLKALGFHIDSDLDCWAYFS